MKITDHSTDDAVLAEMGARLARARLDRNLTQAQFAERAGVARITVARLEAGESVKLPSLIRVLRALGLLEVLDRLIPASAASPIEHLKLQGRRRQRASGTRGAPAPQREPGPWRWGDEAGPDTP